MKKTEQIRSVIARDVWFFKDKKGATVSAQIRVGRPRRVPNDKNQDWMCPISIEHFTQGVISVFGVGPVDSLMNAMVLVKTFFDKHQKHFTLEFNRKKKGKANQAMQCIDAKRVKH